MRSNGPATPACAIQKAVELGLSLGRTMDVQGAGCSMGDAFRRAQSIRLGPVPARLRPGQILILARHGAWVGHRLIACRKNGFLITKPDAFDRLDEPAYSIRDVRGMVLGVCIEGRYRSVDSLLERARAAYHVLKGYGLWAMQILGPAQVPAPPGSSAPLPHPG